MVKKKKRKSSALIKYLFISMLIITFITIGLIYFIDILPINYFGILTGLIVTTDFVFSCLLFSGKPMVRVFGGLITAIYIILMMFAIIYELNTIDFLKKIGENEYITLNYNVVVLKDSNYKKVSDIKDEKVGITNDCKDEVKNKLTKKVKVNYAKYTNYTELVDKLLDKSLNVIVLEDSEISILEEENEDFSNKTKIIYEFSVDIKQKSIKDKADIRKESFNIFLSGIDTYGSINSASRSDVNMVLTINPKEGKMILTSIPRDYYVKLSNISEKSKADFLSKRYVFGFLENEPYTKVINNKLIGLDSSFINSFSDLTGASISIREYKSVKDLTKALNDGKVDIAPNYYNFSSLSGEYTKTISPYDEEYVVLVHKNKTDVVVNSVKSLKGKKVITTNSTLAKYLEKEGKASVAVYDKIDRLIRSINKDSIVVLDKSLYELYKGNKLSNYRVIYNDKENLEYGYIIRKANENSVFEKLFTTYMETLNHKQVYNVAWKNYTGDAKEINYTYFYVIGVVLASFVIWLFARKKIKIKKTSKREETIRYVDPLTSLKNRNYLNKNFKKWENNAIYPQAIIVINLNNLRHVNDVYGHEEGDKLIRLAANILIKNQVDQSDIIRTDGNEYLIYMVGYEKNKVVAYMRKLYKELEELPYGYGATLGYSMIEDDIKTIDDAINEAVLEIRATKEMKNQSK